MDTYEKLGSFYLGKAYDVASQTLFPDPVLYDSKDLTTHAVIIGMTGSGKTGMGITLLEEALIDKIPIIAIDPKGDLTNLALTFPDMRASDLLPWVNPQEAVSKGLTLDAYAAGEARKWTEGLAQWGQATSRIARLKAAADVTVYTPGSTAGTPVSVLRNFDAPPAAILNDTDLFSERIETTTSSLTALLGLDTDPITSREHILIANIFRHAWNQGQSLDLASLIQSIQKPPFDRIGIMELDTFYAAKDRFGLAMRLNNLLAAPGFEAWLEGPPLDIRRLLHTDSGRPQASIFTISHLSDAQRMFFVATLLNAILGWMRTQPGTTSLRALLYMDEIFGYFPPVQNPPSKAPLLRLLKQARAFGLGVALSTQNPVDLDYRGLANTGTWLVGRLQTERDQQRVMDGLQGSALGGRIDSAHLAQTIAGLQSRSFLLHNVHENAPVVFKSRWALSYLRGPLTREQIKQMTSATTAIAPTSFPTAQPQAPATTIAPDARSLPTLPPQIDSYYIRASGAGTQISYVPSIYGQMNIHYHNARYQVDQLKAVAVACELQDGPVVLDWDTTLELYPDAGSLDSAPLPDAQFGDLPPQALKASSYRKWNKDLVRWVRTHKPLIILRCKRLKMTSAPGEAEGAFRSRLTMALHEKRDLAAEKLRRKYSKRFDTLKNRLMSAEQAIAREQEQAKTRQVDTFISFGTAVLGAFLGRKTISATSASRVGTAMKSAGRMQKEKMDVQRAQERAAAIREQMAALEDRLQEDIAKLEMDFDAESEVLDEIRINPKMTNITMEVFGLTWLPYRKDDSGRLLPDW
jgi:hypothetical protein